MQEDEWLHVQKVMERLKVQTVVISRPDSTDERIYINGELVYSGPDSPESRSYWQNELFVMCNTDHEGEWECSARDGTFFDTDLIKEELI